MFRFIKKVIFFVFIMAACMGVIVLFDYLVIGSQYKNNYQASLIDKVNRLKYIDEPKIILVGNSNVAFGIDSEKIEEAIGMPVVNLGLHGGLGNAYHEQIAKLSIREGDIVVVCHSSYSDTDEISDPELAWITYDYNNSLWPIIRKKDYKTMLLAYPTYLKKSYILWLRHAGNLDSNDSYSRNAFNKYGDVAYKPPKGQIEVNAFFKNKILNIPEINATCINRLNELNQYCQGKQAALVVAGYPIAYGEYSTYTKKDFMKFQSELEEFLDCDVISDFTDYFYPYEYFYNSHLHLNDVGTEARTKQLITDLENWLKIYGISQQVGQ